jgi:glucose/mannose transport system permease protein
MSLRSAVSSKVDIDTSSLAKRSWHIKNFDSFLVLLPSIVAIAIFVYAFIAITFYVSISNWRTVKADMTIRQPPFQTYVDLFTTPRFQNDLRNTIIFTALFLASSVVAGLGLAILIDHNLKRRGISIIRNIFLFPYALSFVVTGVVWRWIFNPESGINLLFNAFGINQLLANFGVGPLKPGWLTDPSVVMQVNNVLARVVPGVGDITIKLGIPLALIPVVIAACWQFSGFVMAIYLGGMATISDEIREAAKVDGASEWQVYTRIVIPLLTPVTISAVIILFNVALRLFDLVYAMAGVGPGFATDMPSIFVFETMFRSARYNLGSAAALVMLIPAALIIIPYFIYILRTRED